MTRFVIRHRDRKRRGQMIDEAVRKVAPNWPGLWEWIYCCLHEKRNDCQIGPSWFSFIHDVRAEFRRLSER